MNTPMHTPARTALAIVLGLAASGTPVFAQASAPPLRIAAASSAAVANAVVSESSYDPADIRARLQHAAELAQQGRIPAARREYADIIDMQRSQKALPAEALWNLAELSYSERNPLRAASLLNELAREAEIYGNPQLQAKALLEATFLYSDARKPEQAVASAKRLELLMSSPFITDELRQEVQSRIIRK